MNLIIIKSKVVYLVYCTVRAHCIKFWKVFLASSTFFSVFLPVFIYIGQIMSSWYFDSRELKNTPSFRDGIDYETETRYRREGARFIIDVGADLNLSDTIFPNFFIYF